MKFTPKKFGPNHKSVTQSLFVSASYPSSLGTGQKANVSIGYKPISSGKKIHTRKPMKLTDKSLSTVFSRWCVSKKISL